MYSLIIYLSLLLPISLLNQLSSLSLLSPSISLSLSLTPSLTPCLISLYYHRTTSLFITLGLVSGMLAATFVELRDAVSRLFLKIPLIMRPLIGMIFTFCKPFSPITCFLLEDIYNPIFAKVSKFNHSAVVLFFNPINMFQVEQLVL